MRKEINLKNREEANTPTITYSDREEVIIDNTGKLEDMKILVAELKANGAFERLNKLIEQTRARE